MDEKQLRERLERAEKALVLIGERAVVDWDDRTVGEVDGIVPPQTYNDWVREVMTAAERGRKCKGNCS